jgi:hypothetical protein
MSPASESRMIRSEDEELGIVAFVMAEKAEA